MFTYRVDEDITLRLPDLTDAPELFTLFEQNRDHLTEWQDWPNRIKTLENCQEFILRLEGDYAEGNAVDSLIIFQGKIVGMCTLTKIVPLLRKAEIGYWIAEEYEGKGIVSRSCRGLIAYAFETKELNRLMLKFKHVSEDNENIRSRWVAERLGFTQEGILRQDGMTKGQMMDMVIYSLLADEWREMKKMENG